MQLSRRDLLALSAAGALLPGRVQALAARQIEWEELIPPGVPYSEIIGEGKVDEQKDLWLPVFDENATKLNPDLNGAYIRMPGFVLPIEFDSTSVSSFVLVPYLGACLHTPPPPPNQLVFVTVAKPWPSAELWTPVWVTGHMTHELQSTEVAEVGYALDAEHMEIYEWD